MASATQGRAVAKLAKRKRTKAFNANFSLRVVMFLHITQAKYLGDYKVSLSFNNGESGEVDLSQELYGEVFEPLKDKNYFKNFTIRLDTLTWPNGADFAPEFLYSNLVGSKK